MNPIYKQWHQGDVVRDVYGRTHTVMRQDGCMVFMYDDLLGWYHPNKLSPA